MEIGVQVLHLVSIDTQDGEGAPLYPWMGVGGSNISPHGLHRHNSGVSMLSVGDEESSDSPLGATSITTPEGKMGIAHYCQVEMEVLTHPMAPTDTLGERACYCLAL